MHLCVCVCVCVHVCTPVKVWRTKGMLGMLLHYSPPVPLRRVFSLNLELKCSWIDSKLVSPSDSPVSASFEADV